MNLAALAARAAAPVNERRWVVWVTWVAVLAPLPYSLWRVLWAMGIPVGIEPAGLHDFLQSPGWGSLGMLVLVLLSEGTAAITYFFVLSRRQAVPGRIPFLRGRRVPPWLVIITLLMPIGILASFNYWSLQYVFDGFSVPPEVAEGFPWWSFYLQVLIFWVWGVSLAVATAVYSLRHLPRWRLAKAAR